MDEQKKIFQLMERGAKEFAELGKSFEKLADKHVEGEATRERTEAQTTARQREIDRQQAKNTVAETAGRLKEAQDCFAQARADYEKAQQEQQSQDEINKLQTARQTAEQQAFEAKRHYMEAQLEVAKTEHVYATATQQVKEAEAWTEQLKTLKSSIVWFVHKSRAGEQVFKSAINNRCLPRTVWHDAVSLRKEMQSAFALQMKQTWVQSSKLRPQFAVCEQLLNGIGTFLNTLCRNLEATENPQSPQNGFLRIVEHSVQMKTSFLEVKEEVEKWVADFPSGTLKTITKEVQKLVSLSRRVKIKAQRGAGTCDIKVMQKNLRMLSRDLITAHTSYANLTCQLDFIECRPEVEPPFLFEVRTKLETAGCAVAKALLVHDSIKITEESVVTKLSSAWGTIEQQVKVVEEEVKLWSQRQLCPTPGFCQEAFVRLQSCTRTALKQVAVLQNDPTCQEVLVQQKESIDCVQAEVIALSEKTQSLKENFNQHVFDKFWWPIAQIRVALTPKREEDFCLLTEQELQQLVERWKARPVGDLRRRQFLHDAVGGHMPGFTSPWPAVTSPSAPAALERDSRVSVSPMLEEWKKVETLASALQPLVADPLEPRLKQVVTQIRQEQRRLQAGRETGQALSLQAKQLSEHRLREVYGALAAVYAVTLDNALPVHKQQLAELGTSLPLLHQPLHNGHGSQSSTDKFTAHTVIGVVS